MSYGRLGDDERQVDQALITDGWGDVAVSPSVVDDDLENRGNSGDDAEAPSSPFGKLYALDRFFWQDLFIGGCFGSFMGLVGYLYLTSIEKFQDFWWGDQYGKSADEPGQWLWLAYTSVGGLIVGLCKVVFRFPSNPHGFLAEVQHLQVNWHDTPKFVLVVGLSLCAGASVGPEMAMGSLGGGLAQWYADFRKLTPSASKAVVLLGIAAALGPLFPSPVIGVCSLVELGLVEIVHIDYMKRVALMTFTSTVAFSIMFALKNTTYLPFNVLSLTYEFSSGDCLKAMLIGIVGAFVAFAHVVITGVMNKLSKAVQGRLPPKIGPVLVNTCGGLLLGLLAVYDPFILGSGSKQTNMLLHLSVKQRISTQRLFLTALMKSLAFGLSKSSGFVGGGIFPMITIGGSFGLGVYHLFEGSLEQVLSFSCFMAAVPAAVTPAPISFLLMVALSLNFNARSATPIFIACVSSHAVSCGMGLISKLLAKKKN